MSETCMYCQINEQLDNLMIEIVQLNSSTAYLFRDQTHPGRCVLALNQHIHKLTDLSATACADLFHEVQLLAQVITKIYKPDKINYLILGDTSPHLHVHLVPKYEGKEAWGTIFQMKPAHSVTLSDNSYQDQIMRIRSAFEENTSE